MSDPNTDDRPLDRHGEPWPEDNGPTQEEFEAHHADKANASDNDEVRDSMERLTEKVALRNSRGFSALCEYFDMEFAHATPRYGGNPHVLFKRAEWERGGWEWMTSYDWRVLRGRVARTSWVLTGYDWMIPVEDLKAMVHAIASDNPMKIDDVEFHHGEER